MSPEGFHMDPALHFAKKVGNQDHSKCHGKGFLFWSVSEDLEIMNIYRGRFFTPLSTQFYINRVYSEDIGLRDVPSLRETTRHCMIRISTYNMFYNIFL